MGIVKATDSHPPFYPSFKIPINIAGRVNECLPMHEMLCSVFRSQLCDCGRDEVRKKILKLLEDVIDENAP